MLYLVVLCFIVLSGIFEDICIFLIECYLGKMVGCGFGFGYYLEFLCEGSVIDDYDDVGFVVFGVMDEVMWNFLYMVNVIQDCCLYEVGLCIVEMVKYIFNSWCVIKVMFVNEIGNILKVCGLDG